MDGSRASYARMKRRTAARTAKREHSQHWQAILASGLVGLLGALIGGGVTFATTSRQLESQEHIAATERAHQDLLDRISRRDEIYSAYYASLVVFRDSITALDADLELRRYAKLNPKLQPISNEEMWEEYWANVKLVTTVSVRLTPLQLVASKSVTSAASITTDDVASAVSSMASMAHDTWVPEDETQRGLDAIDVSMKNLLRAMRGDLNVSDIQTNAF